MSQQLWERWRGKWWIEELRERKTCRLGKIMMEDKPLRGVDLG